MTDTFAERDLPDLSTMTKICEERILLCGPCDELMTLKEYEARHRRLNDLAATWTEEQRTDFWHTMDRLCAEGNPAMRATPGLPITPENLAQEDRRLKRIAHQLMDPESEIQGFPVWGFHLYTDPVIYSFTEVELFRYARATAAAAWAAYSDSHDPTAGNGPDAGPLT